jgi:two-component SAPR family response regulator
VSTAKSGGIASQKINHLLWSYKPDDTANNNRNVYMSKLRGLLEGVGDIRIQNQNKLWRIAFEGGAQCDYLEALRLFEEGVVGEEDVDRLLELLLKGQMLPNTELDWIDEYKSAFSNATIDFLCRQLRREDLSDKTLLQAANTIFQHDFLNEDALKTKVSILCRQNKTGLAKTVYDSFCKEYRKSLGEEYAVPFKDLI